MIPNISKWFLRTTPFALLSKIGRCTEGMSRRRAGARKEKEDKETAENLPA